MITNFRLLKNLSIIAAFISALAFSRVPASGDHPQLSLSTDTLSPAMTIVPTSPNVRSGERVFSFLDSTVKYEVYIPEDYSSSQYRYPVVYILNGPIFSPEPGSNDDWRVDELLDSLAGKGRQRCIVVALSGLPLAQGEEESLAAFLDEEVKHFIDENYRTQPLQSVIAGTGYFADVALITSLTRSGEFPRAGVFSPTDSLNRLLGKRGLNGSGFSGMLFIYKSGSREAGIVADNLAAHSSALLYTRDSQHPKRPLNLFGGWFPEFYCWVTGNGFNYIINTKN